MGLDIRIPISAMFGLLGALLACYGLYAAVAAPQIYEKSLGINVKMWWGLVMLVFGAAMFVAGRRTVKNE